MKEKHKFFSNLIGKIIVVDWRDSNMYITQCNVKDDLDIVVITSIGKLLSCDTTKIILIGDIVGSEEDGEIRRVISIPLENVIGLSDTLTPTHMDRNE